MSTTYETLESQFRLKLKQLAAAKDAKLIAAQQKLQADEVLRTADGFIAAAQQVVDTARIALIEELEKVTGGKKVS